MMKGKCLVPLVLCFFLLGCAPLIFFGVGTAAGVAGYKYYQGTLTVVYQAPYMKTWDATGTALEGMNFKIESKLHDRTAGRVDAKRADGKHVRVSLKYLSAEETEAVIRVGILGDREASMLIKEEIRKVLFK
ncbi:MAG: DUF3568 family protein [Deltaproteobacteria bacterium]|nr:DUF3568 family protein [Deltaproteobacteria bacterium]